MIGLSGYAKRDFGALALTESSPSQSWEEPFTIREAQSFLKLPERNPPDEEEEDLLLSMIRAARECAEILQGRDLVRKQWDLSLDYWPTRDIELRRPLVSVDLIQRRSSSGSYAQMTEDSDFFVDTARGLIVPPYGQDFMSFNEWHSSAILIRFTSGYLPTSVFWRDAGSRIKIGMKMLISAWFFNRIPFSETASVTELPWGITSCLSHGSGQRLS